MPIQVWSDRIWVVTLANEPALSEELNGTRQRFESAGPAAPHLVLDLSAVTHLNSSNLSQLLRLRKAIITFERKMRLAKPTDPVWAVLLLTGLEKVFDFAPDVPTALASLQIEK